eukprot:15357395-Ditylum_brightwellii.AAC.1
MQRSYHASDRLTSNRKIGTRGATKGIYCPGQKVSKCSKRTTTYNTGRWSQSEKCRFLLGFKKFGKGRWKLIHDHYLKER